jgi:hypothetical protein
MKKLYFFLTPVLIILGFVLYQTCDGKIFKKASIKYDQAHVEKLRDFTGYKQLDAFKKVGEIADHQVTFLECWEGEAGDFRKVQIKLQNGHTMEYDNSDGWIKFTEPSEPLAITLADMIKLPENSNKIRPNRYGVTLDMGNGNYILMLFGYPYANDAGLLTLIYVSKDQAEIIFNKEVDVLEVAETTKGYRIAGELDPGKIAGNAASPIESPGQSCEICIEDGRLTFKSLKVDESSPKSPTDQQSQEKSNEPMSPNAMLEHWSSSTNWEEVSMSQAQDLANQGHFVAAGAKTGPQKTNGHVVVIVPGKEAWSKSWESNVPMAMDTGKGKRWSTNKLSYSFCKKDKERIRFFLYKGPIHKQ